LIAPLVRRKRAQSNTERHRSITDASRLRSGFLKRYYQKLWMRKSERILLGA